MIFLSTALYRASYVPNAAYAITFPAGRAKAMRREREHTDGRNRCSSERAGGRKGDRGLDRGGDR